MKFLNHLTMKKRKKNNERKEKNKFQILKFMKKNQKMNII